jgi:DDE superfamily endonuclease
MRAHHAKKNDLKPWLKEQWVIPPKANAEFVCAMEDVLEVYTRPYDPTKPQVCLDEASKQLVAETRAPLPAEPGQVAREDYEYERCGTANLFMVFEPLAGQRHVKVTQRRTATDFAHVIRDVVDHLYPDAETIVLVMDNLNTHKLASLYEAFEPVEARRLLERLEIHYTPKHGSWLNMAETELSVLARQCLDRRIADQADLAYEVAVWQDSRNEAVCCVDWQFTTADARIKLKRLYPSIEHR